MQVKHNIIQGYKNITSDLCNIKRHLTGAKKIITFSCTIITLSLLNIAHTSALTYQDEIDMQFTFNPTVSINVTGDLTIPDLAPGSYADSNIITVTAGSNDAHGYTLYGTVGSSSSNYTDLRLSSSNTANVFTNLSSNKATLANFSDNTWGYSYSTDSGSTWKSGNTGSTSSGYNGLPLYNSSNNASGVILASTNNASETSLQFKIGAKAASTQVAGTYTNIINFIGVGKVVTTNYTLTYNGNDANTGTTPTAQSGSTTDGVITLSETTPTRDGYIFKGWCDTDNSSDPTTCSGTTYDPGRIYIIPAANQGGTVTVNMYAIWKSTEETPAGETWYFNENIDPEATDNGWTYHTYSVDFISNNETFNIFEIEANWSKGVLTISYKLNDTSLEVYASFDSTLLWNATNTAYRTITITGGDDYDNADFRTWLSANATQL